MGPNRCRRQHNKGAALLQHAKRRTHTTLGEVQQRGTASRPASNCASLTACRGMEHCRTTAHEARCTQSQDSHRSGCCARCCYCARRYWLLLRPTTGAPAATAGCCCAHRCCCTGHFCCCCSTGAPKCSQKLHCCATQLQLQTSRRPQRPQDAVWAAAPREHRTPQHLCCGRLHAAVGLKGAAHQQRALHTHIGRLQRLCTVKGPGGVLCDALGVGQL